MSSKTGTVLDPAVAAARRAAAWEGPRLAVIDVETTGLALQDRVIAVCLLDVVAGRVKPRPFYELVDLPDREVIGAYDTHHLAKEDLHGCPDFSGIVDQVTARLTAPSPGRFLLCGHNVNFDARFLAAEYELA